jgi:cytochrome c-type biogenesis protein CcmF
MIDIGAIALRLAFVVAVYATTISFLGGWRQKSLWVRSAERAVYAVFALVSIAMVVMLYALATHDFSVQYVARVSNRAMPMFYTMAALWGGRKVPYSFGSGFWWRTVRWQSNKISTAIANSSHTSSQH